MRKKWSLVPSMSSLYKKRKRKLILIQPFNRFSIPFWLFITASYEHNSNTARSFWLRQFLSPSFVFRLLFLAELERTSGEIVQPDAQNCLKISLRDLTIFYLKPFCNYRNRKLWIPDDCGSLTDWLRTTTVDFNYSLKSQCLTQSKQEMS